MYRIVYSGGVATDLKTLSARHRSEILDQIEIHLEGEPQRPTRRRKILIGLVPPWDHVPPLWQLRVGEYRVFYDVDEAESVVFVRAIRHKPPHKTTEEIV